MAAGHAILEHDIDKWNLFKFYNQRDVEVEQSIQKKLVKYLGAPILYGKSSGLIRR